MVSVKNVLQPEPMELDVSPRATGFNPFETFKKQTIPRQTGFNPFARNLNVMVDFLMEVDEIASSNDLSEHKPMEIDVEDPMDLFFRPSKFFKLNSPPPPIVFKKPPKKADESNSSGIDEVAIFFGDNQLVKTGFLAPGFLAPGFFNPQPPESHRSIGSKYPKKRKLSEIVNGESEHVVESLSKRRCSNVGRPFDKSPNSPKIIGKDSATAESNKIVQNIDSYEHFLANRRHM